MRRRWCWHCERWRPRRKVDAQEPMEGLPEGGWLCRDTEGCWEANGRVTRRCLRHTAGNVQQPYMLDHMRWALDAPRWRKRTKEDPLQGHDPEGCLGQCDVTACPQKDNDWRSE